MSDKDFLSTLVYESLITTKEIAEKQVDEYSSNDNVFVLKTFLHFDPTSNEAVYKYSIADINDINYEVLKSKLLFKIYKCLLIIKNIFVASMVCGIIGALIIIFSGS